KGQVMSISKPEIRTSKPFNDVLNEGQTFTLLGIRVITGVQTQDYGEGEMVILDVRLPDGTEESVGIWGVYITAQARSAEDSDFPAQYQVVRDVVSEFSKR